MDITVCGLPHYLASCGVVPIFNLFDVQVCGVRSDVPLFKRNSPNGILMEKQPHVNSLLLEFNLSAVNQWKPASCEESESMKHTLGIQLRNAPKNLCVE